MKTETLTQLRKDQETKRPVALATDMTTGAEALVYHDDATGELAGNAELMAAARQALQDDRSGVIAGSGTEVFVHVYNPPLRLILVGAVHIAQPLSRMASVGGYDVTVIDPRGSFNTEERFPGIALAHDWPDDAMRALDPDRRTAVVTLTHDPKLDDPGLSVAIRSAAFYVGSLGSRGTHAKRVARLKEEGFTESEIGRIHAPVGLSIGAKSPAEISVSILAEITDVLHAREKKAAA
ncbi:MAG: XdhC family protein [Alphaproteobacteria bacterium]